MEQYVDEEISFEEYKEMLSVFSDKMEGLEQELERVQAELPAVKESPDIAHEDIIANIQENWEYLSNNERMMFFYRSL